MAGKVLAKNSQSGVAKWPARGHRMAPQNSCESASKRAGQPKNISFGFDPDLTSKMVDHWAMGMDIWVEFAVGPVFWGISVSVRFLRKIVGSVRFSVQNLWK